MEVKTGDNKPFCCSLSLIMIIIVAIIIMETLFVFLNVQLMD